MKRTCLDRQKAGVWGILGVLFPTCFHFTGETGGKADGEVPSGYVCVCTRVHSMGTRVKSRARLRSLILNEWGELGWMNVLFFPSSSFVVHRRHQQRWT